MPKAKTKTTFFRELLDRGYDEAVARDMFRGRYGYFPEMVGEEQDLRELRGDKRKLPRDPKTGRVLYGPRNPDSVVFLPEPSRDEQELQERLAEMRRLGLSVHPRHVGRAAPMEVDPNTGVRVIPEGRDRRDVVSFSRLERMTEGGPVPDWDVTFIDDLPTTPPESPDPDPGKRVRKRRAFLPRAEAHAPLPMPQGYVPAIDLEPEQYGLDFGLDAKARRAMARAKADMDPIEGAPDLETFDVRTEPPLRWQAARKMINTEYKAVRDRVRTKARQLAKEQGMPEPEADKVADHFLQQTHERSDKSVAQSLWFALKRAQSLVLGGKVKTIEEALAMSVGDAEERAGVELEGMDDEGNETSADISWENQSPGHIKTKSLGDWLRWLWDNLSDAAKERLLTVPALQEYKTIEALDAAVQESPFVIHPDDVVQMYQDRTREGRKRQRDTFMAAEPGRTFPGVSPKWAGKRKEMHRLAKYWSPGTFKHGREIPLESLIHERVYERLRVAEEAADMPMKVARTVAGVGAAALGTVEGVVEAIRDAGGPQKFLGMPGQWENTRKEMRDLTPEEKEAARAIVLYRNITSGGMDYLTDEQIESLNKLKGVDKAPYYRVREEVERMLKKQAEKSFARAFVEEVDLIVEMIPAALEVTAGVADLPHRAQWVESGWDLIAKTFASSRAFWKDAGNSMIADVVLFADDPPRHFRAMPLSTSLLVAQGLGMMRDTAAWAKLPQVVKVKGLAVIEKAAKLRAAYGILSEAPTRGGWKRLKKLKGVVTDEALAGYYKALQATDPIARTARRIKEKFWAELTDKASTVERNAADLLGFVFRESQESGVSTYMKSIAEWRKAAEAINPATNEPIGIRGAFDQLTPSQQRRILSSVTQRMASEGLLPEEVGKRAQAVRKYLDDNLERMVLNDAELTRIGRVLVDASGRKAGKGIPYTLERPWNIAVNIVEDAMKMAQRKESGIPLRAAGEGSDVATRGFAMLHADPEVVILLLEDMLKNKTIWGKASTPMAQTAGNAVDVLTESKRLKMTGEFGRIIHKELLDRMGVDKNAILEWKPIYGDEMWKKGKQAQLFQDNLKEAIKELKRYVPLSNRGRAAGGLPIAEMNPTTGGFVRDRFHRRGTWVHKDVDAYLAGGARNLPWEKPLNAKEIAINPERLGHRELLASAKVPLTEAADHVKSGLMRAAFRLGIEGITGKTTVGKLHELVMEAAKKAGDLPPSSTKRSRATTALLTRLQEQSYLQYVDSVSTAAGSRLPAVTRQAMAARWKELAAIAAERSAMDVFDVAAESALIGEAHTLAKRAQRSAIREAFLEGSKESLTILDEAVKGGERPSSLPSVILMDDADGVAKVKERLAKIRDEALVTAKSSADIARIKRTYADVAARLDKYVDFARDNPSLRAKYGLPTNRAILVPDQFAKQLELDAKLTSRMLQNEAQDFWFQWINLGRRGQTVYNTRALFNNTVSNFLLEAMARGVSPAKLSKEMHRVRLDWMRWEVTDKTRAPAPGVKPYSQEYLQSPEGRYARMRYNALRKAGINYGEISAFAQDVFSNELLASEGKFAQLVEKVGGKRAKKILAALKGPLDLSKRMYKGSDDVFRGARAVYGYDWVVGKLKNVKVGEKAGWKWDHRRSVHLKRVKTPSGADHPYGTWEIIKGKNKGKVLTQDELDSFIARAARYGANEHYVPYGDVPNWPARIRAMRLTNIASPHYTWRFYATPRPGTMGIAGRIFKDPVDMYTTSGKNYRANLRHRAKRLTQHIFLQGMEAHQQDDALDFLRMAHAYDPKQVGAATRFSLMANPLLVGVDSIRTMNFAEPAAQLLSVGQDLVDGIAGLFGKPTKENELAELISMLGPGALDGSVEQGTLRRAGYSADNYVDLKPEEQKRLVARLQKLQEALMRSRSSKKWGVSTQIVGLAGGNLVQVFEELWNENADADINRVIDKAITLTITGMGRASVDMVAKQVAPDSLATAWRKYKDKPTEEQISGMAYMLNLWTGMGTTVHKIPEQLGRAKRKLARSWAKALIPKRVFNLAKDYEDLAMDPNAKPELVHKAAAAARYKAAVMEAVRRMTRQFEENYRIAMDRMRYVRMGMKGIKRIDFGLTAEEQAVKNRSLELREQGRQRGLGR